jgi:hypothetical protein
MATFQDDFLDLFDNEQADATRWTHRMSRQRRSSTTLPLDHLLDLAIQSNQHKCKEEKVEACTTEAASPIVDVVSSQY